MREANVTPDILAAAEQLWSYHSIYDPPRPVDLIVGLGSYDLRVADRCAELYAEGLAPLVLMTGAEGNWTKGMFAGSEAAAFGQRAMTRGVPGTVLLLEEMATNIGENLRFSAAMLPEARCTMFVTKPQTQRRVTATAGRQCPELTFFVTAPCHDLQQQPFGIHGMSGLIDEMVGDLARMDTYAKAGFQLPQVVPHIVQEAFAFLVSQGFTAHLPR
jgi:uncharacterized SAM-binding protein YcdF (DUF218 family)